MTLRAEESYNSTTRNKKPKNVIILRVISATETPFIEQDKTKRIHFTDEEICEIMELGTVLRRIRSRLVREGITPQKESQIS